MVQNKKEGIRIGALSFAESYRSLRAMIQALKFGNSEGGEHRISPSV
jgi:hypothetical protein